MAVPLYILYRVELNMATIISIKAIYFEIKCIYYVSMAVLAEKKRELDTWTLPEEAFEAIDGLIKPGDTILELGSGAGTAILLEKYVVYSVEHDPEWIIRRFFPNASIMIPAPLEGGWYDRAIVNAHIPKDYDLLIIDGPVGSDSRIKFLQNFDLFRVDVPILIDDVHRQPEMHMATALAVNIPYDMEVIETANKRSFAVLIPV